ETDLALLRKLKAAGIPVVSVFLSGRPLWTNPHINASDAFVAAWLPGTEGSGVADVLIGTPDGKPRHDFKGKLSFSWPKLPTQAVLNRGGANYDPLFAYGFGLTYADRSELPQLTTDVSGLDLTRPDVYVVEGRAVGQWKLEQSDREIALRGNAIDLSRESNGNLAIAARLMLRSAPSAPVRMHVAGGSIDVTPMLRALPLNEWQTIRVRLRCFADAGADMTKIDVPLRITSDAPLPMSVADVRLVPVADQTCP
ncbi:MAG TPA: putative glycoside hydrolase, partial [Thermoanaerobaculia bacterium]